MLLRIFAATLAALHACAQAADSVLIFNELQYHPANPASETEWVELRSLQAVDVDIGAWRIEGGIDYTFPEGTIMPGGGYLVVAANPGAIPGALGPFAGQLDNGGETLRLVNRNGRVMDELEYDDEGDWPVGPDGSGATLARRNATASSGASEWTTSASLGGTPGGQNFPLHEPIDRALVANRASWKYRDAAEAPPADWSQFAFNDATWSQGNAALGTLTSGGATLTVTTDLVERFRASAITGVADGGVVATWLDEATGDGVAQNATAGGTTPTLRLNVTPSGKPVVRFDGNDQLRTTMLPGIAATGGFVYFVVVKGNGTQANGGLTDGSGAYIFDRHLTGGGNPLVSLKAVGGKYGLQKRFDSGAGLGGPVSTSDISSTAFQIVAVRRNRAQNRFELWVNGIMEATETDTGAALTPDPINIARHATGATQGLNGDIAEVLIYRSELTDANFQAVGSYLETEYGIDTAFPGNLIATPLSTEAPTSYFRKSFTFPGDPSRTELRLSHTIADGAVFYLNGQELMRTNMPGGAVTHTTPASSIVTNPTASIPVPVPAGALLNGTNVLAVSLHKAASSPGVLFDALLESTETPINPSAGGGLTFSEITGASDAGFYVELHNPSASPVSTSGWSIAASSGQTVALAAHSVAAGGFLTLDAAALGFTPADGTRLFLLAPGGTELRDAREVTNRPRGLTSDGRWGHPTTLTPGGSNIVAVSDAIVINEIFYHAPGNSPEGWVELHNRSGAPVDISLWKFSDGIGYQFPANTPPIAAGGYAVVAWDPAAFATLHPGVTAFGPYSGSLSGKGEKITLRDHNGNVADQVTYADSGRWSEWADGGGSSLELRDPNADNTKPEAWDASDESSKSSWFTVTDAQYQGLATTASGSDVSTYHEFVFGLLDSGEFLIDDISVKNVSLGNINLIQNRNFDSGTAATWRIIGSHQGTVVDDPESPGNKVLKVTASSATEHMHNHAETTLKQDGGGYHITNPSHTYSISFRAKWLRGSNRLHTRLWHNRLPRQTLLPRPVTGGTPGAQNSRYAPNIGPTFDALSVSPVVPPAGQPATVTIKVEDPNALGSVQLFASINGGAFTSASMTPQGGGIYSATVPGQSAGALAQFYIRATDGLGQASFFPPAGPASRAMIPWDDGRAILQMPSGARPHNIRVVLPRADATDMYKMENLMSDGVRPCTVIFNESRAYYHAGVRLKSSEHGRISVSRCGYTLEFGADDLFLGRHDTIAIDRSGGVVTGQKEILLRRLSNTAGGIYTSEDDLVRVISAVGTAGPGVQFDGAGITGAAILSKTRLDKEYLDAQFPDGGDGSMHKYERIYILTQTINPVTRVVDGVIVPENPKVPQDSTGPPAVGVQSIGANKEAYRWYWLLQNAREADDFSGVMATTSALGASNSALMAQNIDVSTWLRSTIPASLYGVIDNYLGSGTGQHNVLFYFPPGGKCILIPWDLDFLNQGDPNTSFTAGGDVGKFINPVNNGAWRRMFYGHMLDILNRSFNTSYMTAWATHYSRFGTDDMVSSVNSYLTPRANAAMNAINAAIPNVAFTRTSASPTTVSTPFATVSGNGWVNVDQIRMQGSAQPLAVTWTSATTWSLQLPISAGTNTYTLLAFNPQGAQVGSTTVTITGSGGIFPASPGSLVVSELNYNPAGDTDATEFIELLNITGAALELGGCHFDEELGQGIAYTFPNGTQIPAGGRILIVRDRAAYAAAYGNTLNLAPNAYTGALDNSGETLVLYAASGQVIFRFTYSDGINATDGGGKTLVRVLSSTNPDPSDYTWRASIADGGNPNGTDAIPFSGSALADTDGDGFPAMVEYAFGTSDTDPNARPPSPAIIFNANGTISASYALVPNADDVITTVENTPTLPGTWTAGSNTFFTPARHFRLKVTLR